MYVGDEPHRRILSGDVRRGEVLRIRAAMLFADMRNFTGITGAMSEEEATDLVNQYYDCIVPPIDERGGEVLKFIGDGILAIFRAGEDKEVEACWRALAAARAGLETVARRNGSEASRRPLRGRHRASLRRCGVRQRRLARAARLYGDRPRREPRRACRIAMRPAQRAPALLECVQEPAHRGGDTRARRVQAEGGSAGGARFRAACCCYCWRRRRSPWLNPATRHRDGTRGRSPALLAEVCCRRCAVGLFGKSIPEPRKGMPSPRLDEGEFKRRFLQQVHRSGVLAARKTSSAK